jgi:uncharacterized protein with PQ loop repeat
MSSIGSISLNISFSIYLVWFIPQILLNFKRKNTDGLSLFMHSILCLGYLCDLMYGFGRDMQWQYRTVTIIGLISLSIQHIQIAYYGLKSQREKLTYFTFNIIFILLFITSICVIKFSHFDKEIFDLLGMCTNTCWLMYGIPQIIKNYSKQSTIGLSTLFICFAIFLNLCDTTSAWALNWDYPSKIGPMLSLIQNFMLLSQVMYYARSQKKFVTLLVHAGNE